MGAVDMDQQREEQSRKMEEEEEESEEDEKSESFLEKLRHKSIVFAENIKRRASLILDAAENPLKGDSEDIFRIDDLEKNDSKEGFDYNAIEEKSQKPYKNPLERCLSAREM